MKVKFYFLLFTCTLISFSVYSQKKQKKNIFPKNDDVYSDSLKLNNKIIQQPISDKPSQEIYVELAGPGLGLSLNYDTRFKSGKSGLGLRVGAGITLGLTIPFTINYIIGNEEKRSFLEIGAGSVIYIDSSDKDTFISLSLFNENKFIPKTYIAYRYKPFKNSIVYRAGITQLYLSNEDANCGKYIIPSLSLGYTFRNK